MDIWDILTFGLTATAAIAAFIFVGAYLFGSPWWKNPTGVNTMAFMAVVAVTLILTVAFRATGNVPPGWLRIGIWTMINIPLWWKIVLLMQAQHGRYMVRTHQCTSCGQPCSG